MTTVVRQTTLRRLRNTRATATPLGKAIIDVILRRQLSYGKAAAQLNLTLYGVKTLVRRFAISPRRRTRRALTTFLRCSIEEVERLIEEGGGRRLVWRSARAEAVMTLDRRPCAHCGHEFSPARESAKYCSVYCQAEARVNWRLDSNLKARFVAEMRRLRLSLRHAAETTGHYSGLRHWLQAADTRLSRPMLEAVARWLNISINEAVLLQGGTAEERQREICREATARRIAKFEDNPALSKKAQKAAQAGKRDKVLRKADPKKLSASLKAYRKRPDAHPLGLHTRTQRGRIQAAMKGFLKHHPHPDQVQIVRWAKKTGERLGRSSGEVLDIWRPILRKRAISLPPRLGKMLEGGKAATIRSMRAEGKTTAEIAQEGRRRAGLGEVGWDYSYVYNVLGRQQHQ